MLKNLPDPDLLPDETASSTSYKSRLIARFILEHNRHLLLQPQREVSEDDRRAPVMVSMQGPQGAGKSTLAAGLQGLLQASPYNLNVAVVSLDDFYLTHDGLVDLAERHPDNKLLHGRGQPGTHDVPLLVDTLHRISRINQPSTTRRSDIDSSSMSGSNDETIVNLPVFDKSLFAGQGDRAPLSIEIRGSLDVFILEGWSLGFRPLSEEAIRGYLPDPVPPPPCPAPYKMQEHPLTALLQINENLAKVATEIYPFFPLHVVIRPRSYGYVYDWRLQQERQMKAINGGAGMSDDEVARFVDRYMPAYEVWGNEGLTRREERGDEDGREVLELVYDEGRRVIQA